MSKHQDTKLSNNMSENRRCSTKEMRKPVIEETRRKQEEPNVNHH